MDNKKSHPIRSLVTLIIITLLGAGAIGLGQARDTGASFIPSLALDLQGGTQLILTPVATEEGNREVTEEDLVEAINIIRSRVDASGVSESEISSLGAENIVVAIPGTPSQETLDLIRSSSQMNFRPVLQIAPATATLTPGGTPSIDLGQSGDVQSGASEPQASTTVNGAQSADGSQSSSVAPPASAGMSPEAAKALADFNKDGSLSDTPTKTPTTNSDLEWVTEQALYDFLTLDCSASGTHTEGPDDKPYAACDVDGMVKYLLGPVDVSGANLSAASAGMETNSQNQTTGNWVVSLQFDSEGTVAFAESSKRLVGFQAGDTEGTAFFGNPDRNHFAIVLDGQVITAPSMNSPIPNGMAQISGNFTPQSATLLANQLNFGSLPLNFEVQSEQQISATLGSEHLEKGIWAGMIGLLLVVLYMIWQYRGLAIISAGSLLVAGVLTYLSIALLSWIMGYRLSLAGIAGLIVAVGVTADSFIVYFERIRDEVREGRPLVAAVSEGWDRAKRTILISDAVNLVAAVVLYVLAVGGVQGFAFTLGLTTIIDLVVIFLFTHPMMELFIRTEFFGGGHKLSGLDPEQLGATNAAVYAGRGRVRSPAERKPRRGKASDEPRLSLAEKRRLEQLKAQEATQVEGRAQS